MTTSSRWLIKVSFSACRSRPIISLRCVVETGERDRKARWIEGTPPNTSFEDISLKPRFAAPFLFASLLIAGLILVQSAHSQAAPRRIEVTAKRFEFTPGEITLKKGEPVVLVLKSADVPHGLRFRELGVEVKAGKGQTSEVAFTPSKAGTFVGHCSVFCGAGHGGMALTLHVTE